MLNKTIELVQKHLLLTLLIIAGLRVVFLAQNGLDLLGDESYYWDWSRRPDWCYYSKPPMVAWVIGISTYLFGDSAFVVRLPAVILGTVFLFYFHATTKLYYGERTAAFALLVMLATPINLLANFIMTIDPPLYCFWMMSLYFLSCALFTEDNSSWLKAGVASSAALLSKQLALALPIMVLIFILITPAYRRFIIPYLRDYFLPILLAALLIVYWNSQHEWVMFGHSQGHFTETGNENWVKHLQHARDFWVYQLLLITPPVFVLIIISAMTLLYTFKRIPAEQRFLWLMGPGLLLGILVFSFIRKMQGNWPMPFYFTALILVVGQWKYADWPRLWKWILGLGFSMVLITSFLPILIGLFDLQKTQWDPTKRFKSWQPIATQIDAIRLRVNADLQDAFIVSIGHRSIASQLAFYLHDHPEVFRYEASGSIVSQYEVWGGPHQYAGRNAFLIGESPESALPTELLGAFDSVRLVGQVNDPNRANAVIYVFYAQTLRKWPVHEPQDGKLNDYE